MSLAERTPIAAALSAVDGVQGFAYRPKAARLGDAWPVWVSCAQVTPGIFETSWRVEILVPTDELRREEWIDERLQGLVDSLSEVLYVVSAAPGVSSDTPALILTCKE